MRPAFDPREWLAAQLETEAGARSGFFLLPVAMMFGIACVYGLGWRPSPWPCLAAAALFAGWSLRTASKPSLALAGLLLGLGLAAAEIARNDTVILSGEATARVVGRVLWRDRDERGRLRYLVAVERTERPTLSRAPQRIEILVSARHEPIAVGGTYAGLTRLRPPSGPALPGGYDFAFGAFLKGLGAYGFALGSPDPPLAEAGELSFAERLVVLRLSISDRIRHAIGGAEGAVAAAIITGERSGIPKDVDEWLRVTGLSHVLSISGLHMALVAGFAMGSIRVLCALVPAVALRMPTKKIAALAALAISAFYLALSGADVAATRSFVMIAVMLTAILFDRSAMTIRNVAIAAIVVLCATPHAVLTASFQMSFAATLALVAAYGAFARRGGDPERRRGLAGKAMLFFVGIAVSSLVAGIATAPFSAYHFQRLAPFGLIANMLALPIFSFWIMPLALVSMLAMPFGLDGPLLRMLGEGLGIVFAVAGALAERFPDSPTGLLTMSGVVLLSIALLCACLFASRLRLVAVPFALAGVLLVPDRSPRPELLVFENGREIALLENDGQARTAQKRPNAFVHDQWARAYPPEQAEMPELIDCEVIEEPADTSAATPAARQPDGSPTAREKPRQRRYCRAATRSGLRIVWTDDYRQLDRACAEADLAIVARAVRARSCTSPARLVTLRTLRETGSLAFYAAASETAPRMVRAVTAPDEEWNAHRRAAWPERWRRGDGDDPTAR